MAPSRSMILKLSLTPDMHARLKAVAAEDGVPMSTWIAVQLGGLISQREQVRAILSGMGTALVTEVRKESASRAKR